MNPQLDPILPNPRAFILNRHPDELRPVQLGTGQLVIVRQLFQNFRSGKRRNKLIAQPVIKYYSRSPKCRFLFVLGHLSKFDFNQDQDMPKPCRRRWDRPAEINSSSFNSRRGQREYQWKADVFIDQVFDDASIETLSLTQSGKLSLKKCLGFLIMPVRSKPVAFIKNVDKLRKASHIIAMVKSTAIRSAWLSG
ncbi:hypothetical protein PAAG_05570 [Paracoccidioides lutzii Pb01]|uniref:Uncharacterized protein n=1 Tax=Paracoccidioides lutzii (strain ATCC MYA-826 / Pb01) TaxID=502779 RepID=C1H477_PARBA|nr:hypothetical protein PAAG_05570 [Paracoccidioides lutzii Pb01]EEH34521.2 hypothetical protein PAAG_05570 [Paracoccidioides lutzii Pb01]